ncbi:MAG: hypothetical protein ACYSPI_09305 [Planctomycetota bacterium]|jgi:hypothetical protein
MALVSLNLKPSDKQLNDFGLIGLIMCFVIGLVLLWLGKIPANVFMVFAGVGIVLYIVSRISVALIKPVYLGLIVLTFPIGWVISHLMMALFYYGIITPVGLLFRLLNRDPLCRKYKPDADTYWIRYKKKRPAKDYFRQF